MNFFIEKRLTILFFITGLQLLAIHVSAQVLKKNLNAVRTDERIIIDGKLSEDLWHTAGKATDFIQFIPNPGSNSRQKTEVAVLYDNDAVYIGAMLYDTPDSILRQLSARDEYETNTDAFGIIIDTYFDKQNAYSFFVTAAGVQADAKAKLDDFDMTWNAAWYSATTISNKGWSIEMKIPYSAIRFSKLSEQKWGINFMRIIRRHRERSYWNDVKPQTQGIVNQSGMLTGIIDIKSPIRLAFLPYVSGYGENYNGANANSYNGGVDIKYGLSKSFTLDMTLVPDFGQTRFDNKVLNLSPIEVRYNERRYFFTEGTDLFNKNDLFYTRRVGMPVNYNKVVTNLDSNEIIKSNPATTKLYNATKISGRTKGNLGIGFFNATSTPANAIIIDTLTSKERSLLTAPLTNYNVMVFDQAIKNNSYISFINTNVYRQVGSYNANASALLFKFANKSNQYAVDGSVDMTRLYYTSSPYVGFRYFFRLAKISGNYLCELKTKSISDKFNPNDLGYLDRNNISYYIVNQEYNTYVPFWKIYKFHVDLGIDYYRVFNPNVFQRFNIDGSAFVLSKGFNMFGIYWGFQPFQINDYYEPRTAGRFYLYPENYSLSAYISTDYRKKLALDVEVSGQWFNERNRNTSFISFAPRYRFSNRFSVIYSIDNEYKTDDVGFVANVNDSIYLGVRNLNTVTNSLQASYIFTNRMSLKLDARHYWSQAIYSNYVFLNNEGGQQKTSYSTNHNINFNTFNIFLSFVWQFRPGSEMSVVYQNNIYSGTDKIIYNYSNNFDNMFRSPQSNSLSVKIVYFLDYLTLARGLVQ
ncbi:MAG: carbohydrate binding family 9 domain-containing protein [Bacteroidia bacterium]|nr:carbohydrate binding family 9 domain-containing protein [Bacteroidia bacterium]